MSDDHRVFRVTIAGTPYDLTLEEAEDLFDQLGDVLEEAGVFEEEPQPQEQIVWH